MVLLKSNFIFHWATYLCDIEVIMKLSNTRMYSSEMIRLNYTSKYDCNFHFWTLCVRRGHGCNLKCPHIAERLFKVVILTFVTDHLSPSIASPWTLTSIPSTSFLTHPFKPLTWHCLPEITATIVHIRSFADYTPLDDEETERAGTRIHRKTLHRNTKTE